MLLCGQLFAGCGVNAYHRGEVKEKASARLAFESR